MISRQNANRTSLPARVLWAFELLNPRPSDHLLEIGCGNGVAAHLICDRLESGRLLAIDRSAVAIKRAAERNAHHLRAGRLELQTSSLAEAQLPPKRFDAAFAINVNLFWTGPAVAELDLLRRALKPGGALHLFYGVGPQSAERVGERITTALRQQAFTRVKLRTSEAGFAVSGTLRAPQ